MNTQDAALPMVGLILAGQSSREEDLLADYSEGKSKALIPIAGQPMIAYVLDALSGSRFVKRLVVVGLSSENCPPVDIPIEFVPDQGSLIGNADAGLECARSLMTDLKGVIACGSDLPLVTSYIVDLFVDECLKTDHDLYYGVIERSVMEARFPTSRRTYTHLKEGEFAGGDLMVLREGAIMADQDLWRRLSNARKNPIKQAQMVGGIPTLIKLLLHRLSLPEAERRVSRALQIRGHAIQFPYAEIGMDVDKPFQLEIARNELGAQAGDAAA